MSDLSHLMSAVCAVPRSAARRRCAASACPTTTDGGPRSARMARVAAMAAPEALSLIQWSDWHALQGSSRNAAVPAGPGLYRARIAGPGEVVYIGQTGRSLRERLGMLSTCYREEMPYRDPHTAAPTLWALRHRDGVDFEVSTAVIEAAKVERLSLEAVAITAHRVDHGRSPLANFGGGVAGYRLSSANNAALVAAGRRFRGGLDPLVLASESVPVPGTLDLEVTAADWLGMRWSPWVPITSAASVAEVGLYRLRRLGGPDLVYVGQGRIGSRIRTHVAKGSQSDHRQAPHFAGDLEASWVALDVTTRCLLEVENDAIASHRLTRGCAPHAQFIG